MTLSIDTLPPSDKVKSGFSFTSITDIRDTSTFDRYFGLPILQGRTKKEDLDFVIEKLQKRVKSRRKKNPKQVQYIGLSQFC